MPNLYDTLSYDGFWWLLSKPEMKVAGKLNYQPNNGIHLRLMMRTEDYYAYFEDLREPAMIQGDLLPHNDSYANHLTLMYCFRSGSLVQTSDGISSIEYSAKLAVLGEHYASIDEVRIDSLSVTYTFLKDWVRTKERIFETHREDTNNETIHSVHYKRIEPTKIRIDSISSVISICPDFEGVTSWKEIDWKESAYIDITPDSPQPLFWYLEKTEIIRNLLASLMGVSIYRVSLSGLILNKGAPNAISIFYSASYPQDILDYRGTPVMFFTFDDVRQQIQSIFVAWFEKYDRIGTLIELALGVLYGNHLFPKFEFLALMQSLEGYHRMLNPTCEIKYIDKAGKEKTRECNLSERIQSLYDLMPLELKRQVNLSQSGLRSLVDNRNYYTHYFKPKGHIFDQIELNNAILAITKFFAILIFHNELGISSSQIQAAFLRSRAYGLWSRTHLYRYNT